MLPKITMTDAPDATDLWAYQAGIWRAVSAHVTCCQM